MEEHTLDFVLVPLGLFSMVSYHAWLLRRITTYPTTTIIGINAINRRIWMKTMMEDPAKTGVLAVQTLRNSIMASTVLASTAIALSSLIAAMITGCGAYTARSHNLAGDLYSIKLFAILLCFLFAFLLNVQSIRFYSHASLLVNVPVKSHRCAAEYVARALDRGSLFWSLGLRAFYVSFPLFLWVFGPVAMLCCCIVLVILLYSLDVYSGWGMETPPPPDEEMAVL